MDKSLELEVPIIEITNQPNIQSIEPEVPIIEITNQPNTQSNVAAPNAQTTPRVDAPNAQTTPRADDPNAQTATTLAMIEDGQPATKRPKTTSNVWEHFNRIKGKDTGITKAVCKYCKSAFSAPSKNGTSHLRRHLERCPKRVNKDIKQFLVADSIVDGKNALKNYKFDHGELRRCIALFIVEGSHSFLLVEERGFRRMMSRANPQFNAFSRHTLKRDLMALYASEQDIIKKMILNSKSRVCLTTDNWRNEYTREEYICITTHFVDNDWKLQKRIIRFKALTPPYDGLCIADELFSCLSQWNIEGKLLTITTDNASYNDSMIGNVKRRLLSKKCLVHNGVFFQVRCCAHIINLIVQAGLDVVKDPLDKVRDMIKCVYRSPKRSKKFFEIAQKNFQLKTTKKFRLDMPIRWNSTFMMLDNVLYYKDALIYYCARDHIMGSFALTTVEWENLGVIHKFLRVFYDVTCMFSAVKTPTANLYFKGVWMVHKALSEVANGEVNILSDTIFSMQAKFDKYWGEYNEILSSIALLDPRYKVQFLRYCYDKIYSRDASANYVQKIVDRLHKLFEEYNNSDLSNAQTAAASNSVGNMGDFCDELFSDYSVFISQTSNVIEKSQVDLYLAEPTRDLNEDLDVLDFWNKSSMRYPELAKMACDLLSIPVSTVASESAFSTSGKIITSTRSSLKSNTVQAIVCLRDWIKATDEQTITKDNFESSSDDGSEKDEDDDCGIDLF